MRNYRASFFGEGFEWTRTFADFTDPKFCALSDGALDYVTFQQDQFSAVQFATLELTAIGGGSHVIQPGNADPSTSSYKLSFRCAL